MATPAAPRSRERRAERRQASMLRSMVGPHQYGRPSATSQARPNDSVALTVPTIQAYPPSAIRPSAVARRRPSSMPSLSFPRGSIMHLLSRAVAVAAVLSSTLASAAIAQRRADFGATSLARREATPVAPQQPAAATMTGPEWSIYAGVASGDGAYDVGLVAGGTGRWHRSTW